MGPEATILLMQKVLTAVDASDDADHIPLIVHQNPQVPSRIRVLIEGHDGPDPAPVLAQMAMDLEQAGAAALAMPCNTAHHYAATVAGATGLPFFNMLDLTAAHLARAGARRVGMLASPATRMTGVFANAFRERNLTPVWLEDDASLLSLIQAVKSGENLSSLAPSLIESADALRNAGADHLLVACTELSLMTNALPDDMPWTDSLDCLRDAIVAYARGTA